LHLCLGLAWTVIFLFTLHMGREYDRNAPSHPGFTGWDGVSRTFCQTKILPVCTTQVARIICVSHCTWLHPCF
jgi:hypothetical protein